MAPAGDAAPARSPRTPRRWLASAWRRGRSGLSGPLALSVLLHVAVLLALGQVAFRPARAAVGRYARIRTVKWDAALMPGRVPRVNLPGGRARAVALPAPAVDPAAEELRRQTERIARMREEFFRPMRVAMLPMPVLPAMPSDLPPPPFWDVPLTGNLQPLPPLPATRPPAAEAWRVTKPGRQGSAPVASAATPEPAAADERPVQTPNEPAPEGAALPGVAPAEPAPEQSGPAPDESTRIARADPAMDGMVSIPDEVVDPPAASEPAAAVPPAAAPGRAEPPSGTEDPPAHPASAERAAEPVDPGTSTAGATSTEPGMAAEEKSAAVPPVGPESASGVPAASAPEDAAPLPPEENSGKAPWVVPPKGDAPEPGKSVPAEGSAVAAPATAAAIPAGGSHSGLSGTFRVPLGLALPGFQPSPALLALLKEVEARTQLKASSLGFVSPAGIPAGAPLLYVRGAGAFSLTDAQRTALADYVKKGGTLLFDGTTGAFGESVRAELARLFPGQAPARVPTTDPLYGAYYRLAGASGVRLFSLQATRLEGRPAVILSPAFLGRRWQRASDPDHEAAVALGVNLLFSAAAGRK